MNRVSKLYKTEIQKKYMQVNLGLLVIVFFLCAGKAGYSQTVKDTLLARQYLITGDSLVYKEDYHNAINNFQNAAIGFKENASWKRQVESLIKIANTYFYYLNDYENVILIADEVLGICNKRLEKETVLEANALTIKGLVYHKKNQYSKAIALYKTALQILLKKVGRYHIETGDLEINMGIAYDDWGLSEEAQKHYTSSLKINQELYDEGKKNRLNTVYLNLAVVYSRLGLYQQAIPLYEKAIALDIEEYGEKDPYLAESYCNLAGNYSKIGEHYTSLQYFYKGLNIFKENLKEGDEYFAIPYNGIATQYTKLDKLDKALETYNKSLKIYQDIYGDTHINTAEILCNIGGTYRILKEYDKAQDYLKKAEQIITSLFDKNNRNLFFSNYEFGQLYEQQDQYDQAIEYYEKNLAIALQNFGLKNQNTSEAYIEIARIQLVNKEYQQAIDTYHKSIIAGSKKFNDTNIDAIPENKDYFNGDTQLTALYGKAKAIKLLAKTQNDVQNVELAYQHFFTCDAILDETRISYQSAEDKMSLEKNAKQLYQEAISTALWLNQKTGDDNYLKDAFYFSEKNKSRLLNEQLRKTKATNFAGVPSDKIKEIEEVKTKLAKYTSKLYEYKGNQDTINTKEIQKYEDLVFSYTQKNDSITKKIASSYPKYYQLIYNHDIISVEDIQAKLPARTAFLEYFVTESKVYSFYISNDEFTVKPLHIKNLEEKVIGFREAVIQKDMNRYSQIGSTLYKDLIVPIELKEEVDQVIIVPSGILWHLNFDLLITKESDDSNPQEISYFLKDKVISYANSAELFFSEKSEKQDVLQECLAFSFSNDNASTSSSISMNTLRNTKDDLPGARKEIKAISEIVDGNYFYGKEAGEANFKKHVNQYDLLHLAIHGELDDKHPENSKLFFTQDSLSSEDNYLYNQEIYNLEIPAGLVVLSACNTGSGKISKGEGVMSLGRAFQYAGAKSLLLTSWEVSDDTTPEIMKNFYRNLSDGMNKAKALQKAKLQFLNTANMYEMDPVYWGGFYVLGDISEVNLSNAKYGYLYVLIVVVIIVMGIWFFIRKTRKI
ncbi:CHAT domain-containing tetratricopeptide repeat protein [uncultured Aquimarina sp.]|uniref:CHAT domain-containing protein n=1 Tax=uncultured Aquimarina sp. TaxID=575652 RepID=UPI0026272713|nr:CHAT domain-containing tetratricopeptide repeat protein [uncultured Aquimarina sp.]